MPVPSTIDDLSTTASSNSPAGTDSPQDGDNYIRALSSFVAQLRDKLDGSSGSVTLEAPTINDPEITGAATAEVLSVSGMLTAEDLNVSSTATVTALNVVGDLTVGDEFTVMGATALNGGVQLGNATSDAITFNGSPAGLIISGEYSPTASSTVNIDSAVFEDVKYVRVGSYVWVTGSVGINPTSATTLTTLEFDVPISSDFTQGDDVTGVAVCQSGNIVSAMFANTTTNKVLMSYVNGTSTSNLLWCFSLAYRVR